MARHHGVTQEWGNDFASVLLCPICLSSFFHFDPPVLLSSVSCSPWPEFEVVDFTLGCISIRKSHILNLSKGFLSENCQGIFVRQEKK